MVATGNVDIYLSPDGQKVGYFVPGQRFTPTGAEQDGWIQVVDSNGNVLWIQEGGPYGPVGEATPVPEHICPVDPTETPARTNGWIVDRERQIVIIHEGRELGTTVINSGEELFLFGGPIGRQTPERWVSGGRLISFNHQTGEGILSHQGREYRLQFTPETGYALTKDSVSGWWWADPCQFKAGHMVYVWKYGSFSQTEINQVTAIWALE